ncbi:glycosyltransferase family 4 protein [Xanthomarina sp. F2636L]|uniref:glycosyltransferase family 4 protein n=1 Tax=Xanthomarina sp. F2636L TaxID=2996018 RepID=UPI00225E388D|nr:glycosyltransferase family 1 protein [Xanthomarina sp. F2636L]MCX7551338.1 glycosyltransferase family 1 protein [Xanthomarina sp. F2636L]
MKIGIDAKWYFNGHPSGKVVVENLVNQIIEVDSSNDYYIFLDKKDKNFVFPYKQSNIHLVYVPNKVNAITNFFILPFYTYKHKLDICLYQNYAPLFGAKKRVNYVHDALFMDFTEYFSLTERIYFWPMKYLSKFSNHVITISHSEKERMANHGFSSKENISVVHHGLGLTKESNSFTNNLEIFKKYNLPQNYILYLGRLNVRKNIQSLLKAMPDVNENTGLVIVGKDDHKTMDWDRLINQLNIKNRVFKLGFVPEDDIPFLYKNASVFCFPSFAEGFGLPPLEAMFYNTPTVVSKTTSLPEVCGDASLYVDPKNEKEIASQINKILSDDTVRKSLIAKGKIRVKSFSWEKAAKEVLTILKSV